DTREPCPGRRADRGESRQVAAGMRGPTAPTVSASIFGTHLCVLSVPVSVRRHIRFFRVVSRDGNVAGHHQGTWTSRVLSCLGRTGDGPGLRCAVERSDTGGSCFARSGWPAERVGTGANQAG